MSELKIRKVGNSLGVLFPKEIQENLNISEGDIIDATALKNSRVLLKSKLQHHSQWKFIKTNLQSEDTLWLDANLEDEDDI